MVLLGAGSSVGTLPPLKGPGVVSTPHAPRVGSAPQKSAKSLAPRINDLAKQLGGQPSEARAKSAACELAMLVSRSISACMAVADAKIEPQLSGVLHTSKDPSTQCWIMSVLSNCASLRDSRERQAAAVPALCKLISSPVPEVQHAASLHLATLSHSNAVQKAFGANGSALRMLHDIEGKASRALSKPGVQTLQQEASQYARWALRTSHGRHYKPHYQPKSHEELELENAIAIQVCTHTHTHAHAHTPRRLSRERVWPPDHHHHPFARVCRRECARPSSPTRTVRRWLSAASPPPSCRRGTARITHVTRWRRS